MKSGTDVSLNLPDMKTFFVSILTLASGITLAQGPKAKGKISYEMILAHSIERVDMIFNYNSYIYSSPPPDLKPLSSQNAADSIANSEKEALRKMFFASQQPQTWYGTLGSNVVTNSVWILKNFYCVSDTMKFTSWTIVEDTMTIDGVACQKAFGVTPSGSKLTAWFAPSIPISVAPYTLRGLPGLLIHAEYDNKSIVMRMLSLEWPLNSDPTIALPNDCQAISKQDRTDMINKNTREALKLAEYYRQKLGEQKKDQ